MKEKQQTRDQLLIELTRIRQSHEGLVDGDERRRKEFARAFSWRKPQEMYSPRENEPFIPSWEQIFVEIGKLLALRDFRNLGEDVSKLEFKLRDLEKRLLKNVNPIKDFITSHPWKYEERN